MNWMNGGTASTSSEPPLLPLWLPDEDRANKDILLFYVTGHFEEAKLAAQSWYDKGVDVRDWEAKIESAKEIREEIDAFDLDAPGLTEISLKSRETKLQEFAKLVAIERKCRDLAMTVEGPATIAWVNRTYVQSAPIKYLNQIYPKGYPLGGDKGRLIEKAIGRGGTSIVFKILGEALACKQQQSIKSLRDYKFDFENEIDILRHLSGTLSGHVTKLVHDFVHDGDVCIVMEPIGSMDLAMYLAADGTRPFPDHLPSLGPALYLEKLVEQMLGLADTLAEIHERGVTHRDIRPANILIHVRGLGPKRQIGMIFADFGLAFRENGGLRQDEHQMYLGDPYYAAPETQPEYDNNDGKGASGKPGDVFALGCVFYEILETWYRAQSMKSLLSAPEMPTASRDGTFAESVEDSESEFVRRIRYIIKACGDSKEHTLGPILEVLFDMMLTTTPRGTAEQVATAIRKITASSYFIKRMREQEKPATPAQRALFSDPGYEKLRELTPEDRAAAREHVKMRQRENKRFQLAHNPWSEQTHDVQFARE